MSVNSPTYVFGNNIIQFVFQSWFNVVNKLLQLRSLLLSFFNGFWFIKLEEKQCHFVRQVVQAHGVVCAMLVYVCQKQIQQMQHIFDSRHVWCAANYVVGFVKADDAHLAQFAKQTFQETNTLFVGQICQVFAAGIKCLLLKLCECVVLATCITQHVFHGKVVFVQAHIQHSNAEPNILIQLWIEIVHCSSHHTAFQPWLMLHSACGTLCTLGT